MFASKHLRCFSPERTRGPGHLIYKWLQEKSENVFGNAHSESVKIFFLSFRWIPMSIVVTKENVAEAIYLLEYKFLCSLSREKRWLLIIIHIFSSQCGSGKYFHLVSTARSNLAQTKNTGNDITWSQLVLWCFLLSVVLARCCVTFVQRVCIIGICKHIQICIKHLCFERPDIVKSIYCFN